MKKPKPKRDWATVIARKLIKSSPELGCVCNRRCKWCKRRIIAALRRARQLKEAERTEIEKTGYVKGFIAARKSPKKRYKQFYKELIEGNLPQTGIQMG